MLVIILFHEIFAKSVLKLAKLVRPEDWMDGDVFVWEKTGVCKETHDIPSYKPFYLDVYLLT